MTGPPLSPEDVQQGHTDDEYNDVAGQLHGDHLKTVAKKPVPPPATPTVGSRISDFFSSIMPDRNTPKKYGTAIARGVVDADLEASHTIQGIEHGASKVTDKVLGSGNFISDWLTKPSDQPLTEDSANALVGLGQRQPGAASFVESASQFATGFAVAGEALKPIEALSKVPTLSRAIAGGLSDMTVFDPYKARLSNMIQSGPTWLRNPLAQFLAAKPDDNEAEARLKSGLEGMLTGYTIDKFIAGVKVLRTLGSTTADETGAVPPAQVPAVKTAIAELDNVQHEPAVHGPIVVKQNDNGLFTMSAEEQNARDLAAIDRARMAIWKKANGLAPEFTNPVDAEATAASMNGAFLNARQPVAELTADQVNQVRGVATALAEQPRTLADTNALLTGTDFNFNYTSSPDEARAVIQAISNVLPEATTGLRNTVASGLGQSHAQTVALADGLLEGLDGEQAVTAISKAFDHTENLPQIITATRTYLHGLGNKVMQLSRAADANPDNAVAFSELQTAMNHLWEIHASLAGTSSNVGRALNAHKIVVGTDAASMGVAKTAGAAVEQAPLAGLSKSELLGLARQITMAEGDPSQILAAMRGARKLADVAKPDLSTMEQVNAYRVNAMLSGPKTQIVYAVSHAVTAFQMSLEYWWAGAMSGRTALREQGADQLTGLFLEARDSFRAAAKAFRTGGDALDSGNSITQDAGSLNSGNPISGLADIAKLPSRLLMANSEFFKNLNYRTSVRAQSLRLARQQGITDPVQQAARVADDMRAAFALDGGATNPAALQFARTGTFSNPLPQGTWGGDIQRFVQAHPTARLALPFVRTPINLFKYAWQRTPLLNHFTDEWKADIAAGGDQAAVATAKTQMGTVMWGGAALLAHQGLITGSGPKDPALRKEWLAAGNQPYSVKVPGAGWISYHRLNPTLTAVGVVADLFGISGELHAHTYEDHATAWLAAVASNFGSETFMRSMTETMDALSSGDGFRMKKLLTDEASSFTPNIANQLNPDDTLRETRSMLEGLMARVPGMSTQLEPRRNLLGEQIMKPPGYINQTLNPFTFMASNGDNRVAQELLALGKGMSLPSETRGNITLTDRNTYDNGTGQSPYDRMLQLVSIGHDGSPNLRAALTKKINSPEWGAATDGTEAYPGGRKFQMASMIISKYQDRAFMQMLNEYPKLKQALHLDKTDKRNSLRPAVAAADTSRPTFLPQ